jgi:hypothetical protein
MGATQTILTLTENSDAHGTEKLLGLLDRSGAVEVVYKLGDAGGYHGVVDHLVVDCDDEGDYFFGGDSDYFSTLGEAVEAAKAALGR